MLLSRFKIFSLKNGKIYSAMFFWRTFDQRSISEFLVLLPFKFTKRTENNHIRSIVAFLTTYSKVCCGQLKCLFQFPDGHTLVYTCAKFHICNTWFVVHQPHISISRIWFTIKTCCPKNPGKLPGNIHDGSFLSKIVERTWNINE